MPAGSLISRGLHVLAPLTCSYSPKCVEEEFSEVESLHLTSRDSL
jgi:hypothetical protein